MRPALGRLLVRATREASPLLLSTTELFAAPRRLPAALAAVAGAAPDCAPPAFYRKSAIAMATLTRASDQLAETKHAKK